MTGVGALHGRGGVEPKVMADGEHQPGRHLELGGNVSGQPARAAVELPHPPPALVQAAHEMREQKEMVDDVAYQPSESAL
eukprot:8788134-Pyramimonas_sp.AAC.2